MELSQHPEQRSPISRRDFLGKSGAVLTTAALLAGAGRAWPQETGKKIRMGVVGGGFGATFHWHEHPNCVITGVTDLRPERRERLKSYYHCDKAYDSLEIMVKEAQDIDAVAVFSGAPDHVKHVKLCMERGWHVVSACPACVSVEEAEELRNLKEKTGLRYMMAESSYYQQAAIHTRNLYKEGVLGEVFYTECEYYHDRGDLDTLVTNTESRFYNTDGTKSWRWGLPPFFYPTHSLAFVPGITGERVVSVSGLGWGTDHPWLKDNAYNNPFWNSSSLMQTNKGHMVRCNVFWLCAAGGERAQFFGDAATLYMAKSGLHPATLRYRMGTAPPSEYDLPEQRGGELQIPRYWESDMLPEPMRKASGHGGSAVFISAEFVNALLEDREPSIDVYESLAMTVPGLVAHKSALKDGETMKVPSFDPA